MGNPLNFYTHPDKLDYEKDVDSTGRDLIKQINQTDYMRTTMYCSGHLDEKYGWGNAVYICFVILNNNLQEAMSKLLEAECRLYLTFGDRQRVLTWDYLDPDNNNKKYIIGSIRVEVETKEEQQEAINILMKVLN